ncbi:MAG: hypothetical protein JXR37_06085, partial [Kiritimatiellae bacterium]|nr:hypothetical protein [Kiritimatiellia bacterium]
WNHAEGGVIMHRKGYPRKNSSTTLDNISDAEEATVFDDKESERVADILGDQGIHAMAKFGNGAPRSF